MQELTKKNKTLIVLAGPTAVGKTALSIELAQLLQTEIVSADSRQFFKEMHIGTAKPSLAELNKVPHHLVGHLSVDTLYDVGQFETQALEKIRSVFKSKNTCILCGGSGLYISAVCSGFDDLPEIKPGIREKLNQTYSQFGIQALQNQLQELDLDYYQQVDLNNPQRIIRALEVCLSSGKTYSSFRKSTSNKREFNIIKIALNLNREELYERINLRVDQMMNEGLLDEVKNLVAFKNNNALQTVGYKELFEYLEGKLTLDKAIDLIKQNTRRYAKRQLTWFRKDKDFNWFNPNEKEQLFAFIRQKMHE